MYKTVRHGENSLQYTILPQTEEVLNNSGIKGKGRDYSPSIHIRRSRRRSTLKYVLLIVFGIIVALALSSVPLYVMNGALYARRSLQDHHEVNTASSLFPTGRDIIKSRKKELVLTPEISSSVLPILESSTKTTPTTSTTAVPIIATSERATTPPWPMPGLKLWKTLLRSTTLKPIPIQTVDESPFVGTPSGSVRLLDDYISLKPWEKDVIIKPTVIPEPVSLQKSLKYYPHDYTIPVPSEKSVTTNINSKLFDDVLITTKATTTRLTTTTEAERSNESRMRDLKDALLSVDDDEDMKKTLEVGEVFSLPAKIDPEMSASDSDEVTVSKTSGGWYGARWPFVDTSSYFQWTGYSPGDNLLLPLLVAALSSVCLVLLLALAVKRRRRSTIASAQIGKLTADLQADDNTNLLTAENAEETEE